MLQSLILTIFYEAMNSDFQSFMTSKLAAMYDKFSQFVAYEFIPCRSAKDENGRLVCQSAVDPKCEADLFETCALRNIDDNLVRLRLLCLMQNGDRKLPDFQNCAVSVQADHNQIQQCAASEEGKKVCLEDFNLGPRNDFHTAILVAGNNHEEAVDLVAFEDFERTLCTKLDENKFAFPNNCFYLPDPPAPEKEYPSEEEFPPEDY